jgi:hypothetical protein
MTAKKTTKPPASAGGSWTALDYNRATNVVMETLNLAPCRHEQLWCDLRLAIREVLERPPNAEIADKGSGKEAMGET